MKSFKNNERGFAAAVIACGVVGFLFPFTAIFRPTLPYVVFAFSMWAVSVSIMLWAILDYMSKHYPDWKK
jgi:hypothetical protein